MTATRPITICPTCSGTASSRWCASDAKRAIFLLKATKMPKVRQFLARRLTEELAKKPGPVSEMLRAGPR